jgi:UDP-N-acetylmuramyl pentapeptide phosphotransferase/UDP-N-acetylglucosamine-1-phosphate transferase
MAAGLSGFASWAATRMLLETLLARDILDRPNERSSHAEPVPRGGGAGLVAIALLSWLMLAVLTGTLPQIWPVVAGGALIGVVSWLDDVRGLSALPRFAAQVVGVVLVLVLLPGDALLFDGFLPLVLDRIFLALAWLWFVNLYNFMDGIDGMTGVETISVAGGVALIVLATVAAAGGEWSRAPMAAVVAGGAAGFLVLNWHPARVFIGDVGAVSLGFLVGYLLVWLAAAEGQWAAAILLPFYYWADATLTLIPRLIRREPVWEGHRRHSYQIAVRNGRSHAWVAGRVALHNVVLVALALVSLKGGAWPWIALGAGAVTTGLFLCYLRFGSRSRTG